MKVLHLSRDHPPRTTGGISVAVGGLVQAQIHHGLDCAVVSFDGWRPRKRSSAAATDETRGGLRVWRVHTSDQAEAAMVEAARWRPNIVHVHHGMLWDFAEDLTARVAGVGSCVTTHVLQREMSRLRNLDRPTLSQQGQDAAVAAADAVIAPSRLAESILAADYPESSARLHSVGFAAEARSPRQARPSEAPAVLYSGRFSDIKGTAELVSAVPLLLDGHPELRVIVAGGNPESPKSERRWLRRFAEATASGHGDRLEMRGWVDEPTLAHLHTRTDVALVPSRFETFGLAALEALSRGVPVVGCTAGALPEIVDHGRTGLLSEPRDVRELTTNALRLLNDPDLAAEMGAAGSADVSARFTWSDVVARHAEIYGKLIR